ncbi:uncharacterized protein LOC129696412 isoform X1 [Leucoraja erinacea]|uniref:uncharacterized protein LOC129696412 isoform X1 n=1 Tax=Leucoraja erinaceus TaxID=7782 RepID=UPI0024589A72|nr:uncharacterized protein LOC129696412 isoform X1 [Leucoraja erinacea]
MACNKAIIPYGFKTVVKTLGKLVLLKQPADIHQFASIYFKELIEFRAVNPSLDLRQLVNLFYVKKVVITEGPENKTASEPESADQHNQDVSLPCNMFAPIDQKDCSPIMCPTLEDKPVLHEDSMQRRSVTHSSINKSNAVFTKELAERAAEDKPCFVYLYTSSVNQDKSAFAYICPDASLVEQDNRLRNVKQEPAHLDVTVPNVTNRGARSNCRHSSNEFSSIPILTRIQQAQVYKSTNRQVPVHKSGTMTRRSESFPDTCLLHRVLSSDVAVIQNPIHMIHKAVPIHSEAVSAYAEHIPILSTDPSALDSSKQHLLPLEGDSCATEVASDDKEFGEKNLLPQIIDATPGDHGEHLEKCTSHECLSLPEGGKITGEIPVGSPENVQNTEETNVNDTHPHRMEYVKETGVDETVNEAQDMESILTHSQSDRNSENYFYPPLTYCQAANPLDVHMLHSETQQETLSIMNEVFHKMLLRLDDLELRVQDMVNRLEDLTITVNEIHSAMNITATGDTFTRKSFDQHESYFQN